jgi:hypothetical protein
VTGDSVSFAQRWPPWLEPMAWCALCVVAAIAPVARQRLPRLRNDSFQYLSAASNLRSTQRMATSFVHFDPERSHGTIPSPLTWFPPGYPVAIAAVSMLGCSYETAALLVSIAGFVLVTGGLWWLMRMMDVSIWAARAAVLCWIVNAQALYYSVAAMSESLFTVFVFASILFFAKTAEASPGARGWIWWVASAAMAGLSYWVRYAGILCVLTFVLILLVQTVFGNKPSWRPALAAGALPFVVMLPLMIRNVILVGDWRGRVNTVGSSSIHDLAVNAPSVFFHLILGDGTVRQLKVPAILIAIGLIGIGYATLRSRPANASRVLRLPLTKEGMVLIAFLGYSLGILAIALGSVLAYTPTRIFVPILPHLIVLTTCGVAGILRNSPKFIGLAIALCLLLGYTAGNLISRASPQPDTRDWTEQALLGPDGTGHSIKDRLQQELKPGEVIGATNGQAAGYVLNHPSISLEHNEYNTSNWDEVSLRKELARFGAGHVLVFRNAELDSDLGESRLLGALANCQPPPWLRLVSHNQDVCVYQVQ